MDEGGGALGDVGEGVSHVSASDVFSQFNPGASRCEDDVVDGVCRTCMYHTAAPVSSFVVRCLRR